LVLLTQLKSKTCIIFILVYTFSVPDTFSDGKLIFIYSG